MNRRKYVSSITSVIGIATVAGCTNESDGNIQPNSDPVNIPPSFTCEDDGFKRYPRMYSPNYLRWGDLGNTSIRVDSLSYEYGDTVEITLIAPVRGNSYKWNFELYTEEGWTELRVIQDDQPIGGTDEDVEGGLTWNIDLSEEGITEASRHSDRIRVCPNLVSGRYRFVYYGVLEDKVNSGSSVATSFDISI